MSNLPSERERHENDRSHTTFVRAEGERTPDAQIEREARSKQEIDWCAHMLLQAEKVEGEAREAILGRIGARFLKFTLTTEVMRR